jgi:TonB family protein
MLKFLRSPSTPVTAALAFAAVMAMGLPNWATAADEKSQPAAIPAPKGVGIRYDTCARPTYPEVELSQNHQGTVTLNFLVGANGKVKQSLVLKSSGYPALDEAARMGIAKCSFHPPTVDKLEVDAWIAVQYVWRPQ